MNTESKSIRTSAEEKLNSSKSGTELIKKKELKGTPFTIVTMDGKSFGTLGQHRITEPKSYKEIKEELNKFSWDRIMQVVVIAIQNQDKINKEIKKQLEQ